MASDVDIANRCLTKLGTRRIISLDDNVKEAREVKSAFAIVRDAELRKYNWRFSIKRAQLAAEIAVPPFGYARQFLLPSDYLKAIQVGNFYPGVDLSDYVGGAEHPDYSIEGGRILTNYAAPLPLRYVARVTDPTMYDALFVESFASKLAMELAEPLTQSMSKREKAGQEYRDAIAEAVRVNAIEAPPVKLADDTWVLARL